VEFTFNPPTLEILLSYGWTKDRSVDISTYELHFAETHQPTSSLVITFLQSLGGLRIKGIIVDPLDAYRDIGQQIHSHYQKSIGKPLCLIGWLGKPRSESMLFMSMTGEIYSAWSNYVHLWGSTVEESFDNILVSRQFKVIPMPDADTSQI
jgi:hypothetical protein